MCLHTSIFNFVSAGKKKMITIRHVSEKIFLLYFPSVFVLFLYLAHPSPSSPFIVLLFPPPLFHFLLFLTVFFLSWLLLTYSSFHLKLVQQTDVRILNRNEQPIATASAHLRSEWRRCNSSEGASVAFLYFFLRGNRNTLHGVLRI